ncbi:MAG: serine protease, partial [Actinomycetota bacterium]|nr:serine protease [Actinomycetota bacterium]
MAQHTAFVLLVVASGACDKTNDEPRHHPKPQELARSVVEVQMMIRGEEVAHGSGTVISKDGLILTNAHVATPDPLWGIDDLVIAVTERPREAPVPMYHADVVASDPDLDLALLRPVTTLDGDPYTPGDLRPVTIGDSGDVRLGDKIWVLGYPSIGGTTVTITDGLVSGFNSDANVEGRAWIKTDATIAGGNSGGMALNKDGELIGVPTIAGATVGMDVTDCRRIQDTNQDGLLNEHDSCIPIGGFLNGIRPVNLARSMILEALSDDGGEPTVEPEPVPKDFDVNGVRFRSLRFEDVTPEGQPASSSISLPSGTTRVCAWWRYRGMAEGVRWDAVWALDGVVQEDFSAVDQTWPGGADGNYWVCLNDEEGVDEGTWDLSLNVEGEWVSGGFVNVGDQFAPVDVTVRNGSTDTTVCYLFVAPVVATSWGEE